MLLGPGRGSHALLVLKLEVGALVDQELDDVVLVLLDSVVDGSLVFRVRVVKFSSKVNEMLGRSDVALSDSVIDGRLAILVLSVHVVFPLIHQVGDGLNVALPTSVEKRCLLEHIRLDGVAAHLCEHFDHLEGLLVVWHDTG